MWFSNFLFSLAVFLIKFFYSMRGSNAQCSYLPGIGFEGIDLGEFENLFF